MRHAVFTPLSRLALIGALALTSLSSHAASWYQAQVIESPTGQGFVHAYALNDNGWVVGYGNFNGNNEAFLWQDGAAQALGQLPNSSHGGAYGINQGGQVVGSSGSRAAIWQKGSVQALPGNAPNANGYAINNAGTIVGSADSRAVIWQNGQMQQLPTLASLTSSIALDISETGFVVGSGYTSAYTSNAWRWQGGQLEQLSHGSARGAGATSVNDQGSAAGFIELGGNLDQAARWDGDTLTALDQLDGVRSARAYGINNAGLVVGTSFAGPGSRATLWEGSTAFDLTSRLSNGQGWELWQAMDINNNGQIVGWGTHQGRYVSYLLTPVPEAHSLWMFAVGLLALGVHTMRSRRG